MADVIEKLLGTEILDETDSGTESSILAITSQIKKLPPPVMPTL
jgi:hypothetical protein